MKKYLYAWIMFVAMALNSQAYAVQEIPVLFLSDEVVLNDELEYDETFLERFRLTFNRYLPNTVTTRFIPVQAKGMTASSVLQVMPEILEHRPHVAVVALGYSEARQGVDSLLIYNGIEQLIETLKQHHVYVIMLGARAPDSAPLSYQAQVNNMYAEIAKRQNVFLYPDVYYGLRQHRDMFVTGTSLPTKYGIAMAIQQMEPHIKAIGNQLGKRYALD